MGSNENDVDGMSLNASSDDDDYYLPAKRNTIRGPGYKGHEQFDSCCIFGNDVEMHWSQTMQLKNYAEELPNPPIKPYVCKIEERFIVPENGKMEFSSDFTSAFLLQFLKSPIWKTPVIGVIVNSSDSKLDRYCKLTLGTGGKAAIDFGWPKAVKGFKMEEGSIWIFKFIDERTVAKENRNTFAWLRLVLTKLVRQDSKNFNYVTLSDEENMSTSDEQLVAISDEEEDSCLEPEDEYFEQEDYYLEPEDSYIEPEDNYFEDDDDVVSEMQKITIRGPGYQGNETFDMFCIFGNEVELSFQQVGQLCKYVQDLPMPPIKLYVSKLLKSQTKGKDCKMDFSAEFTSQYLMPLLKAPNSPDPLSRVVVQKVEATDVKIRYCRMKLESGKAVINAGWIAVVHAFKLKEGDICIFSFQDERGIAIRDPDPFGIKTRLLVLKLEEDSTAINNTNNEDEDDMHKITIRGPGLLGDNSFDKECVFGNKVEMNYSQAKQLRRLVEVIPRPTIKEYVCQIMKTNVLPDCKMEFTAEFTCYYLTKILRSPYNSLPHVSVVVNCTESIDNCYCRIKICELGKASIVGGWKKAVETFKLQEGEVCMFSFRDERVYSKKGRDSLAWLRLVITKLYVESFV